MTRSDGRTRIDLSHVVEDGMTTYPGLPAPVIRDVLSREASRERYAPGTEFQIGEIQLCANTGTYVDSPFHRYADGADLAGLPLDRLADLDGVLVDATNRADRSIGPSVFRRARARRVAPPTIRVVGGASSRLAGRACGRPSGTGP